MTLVHYKTSSEPLALVVACGPTSKPQPQTALPRLVTCPACIDWVASHHEDVIARVAALSGGSGGR